MITEQVNIRVNYSSNAPIFRNLQDELIVWCLWVIGSKIVMWIT